MQELVAACMAPALDQRPTFAKIGKLLDDLDVELAETAVVGKTAEDYPLYIL